MEDEDLLKKVESQLDEVYQAIYLAIGQELRKQTVKEGAGVGVPNEKVKKLRAIHLEVKGLRVEIKELQRA